MRIVKEVSGLPCKVTVFSWNGKYLIKLENGPFEQTFKVSELDVLEEELDDILSEKFLSEAIKRFDDMALSLRSAMN
ncbi:hypothetical protein BFP97_10130 [Roseivirga sp. 4D4]|uniref:hypothetical protein n=1 Tax=Roseivirga sp. 4D4 TaxID=1889784 RepID=UPI0008535237|nr:hypothetical protein [Roseivirga sp. 4D4]OEK01850.1 hypothetical protein BFP97_10130 [Roseivirga sp. 4D4]